MDNNSPATAAFNAAMFSFNAFDQFDECEWNFHDGGHVCYLIKNDAIVHTFRNYNDDESFDMGTEVQKHMDQMEADLESGRDPHAVMVLEYFSRTDFVYEEDADVLSFNMLNKAVKSTMLSVEVRGNMGFLVLDRAPCSKVEADEIIRNWKESN